MMTRASNGDSRWAEMTVSIASRMLDGASQALERRPDEMELAQARPMKPIGLLAEVAQAGRGLRADHSHPDEIDR